MERPLTAGSPFLLRFWAYLQERFPLFNHGLLIISYYSSNQFLAQALLDPGGRVTYSLRSLLGGVILLAAFFHLRVFDEHKDYDDDCRFHPHRVLQRGLVTLDLLSRLGMIAITFELALSACLGWAAFTSVLVVLFFSILMRYEFFMPAWLKKHFLLYAASHMAIMPLFSLMVFSITTGRFFWEAPGWYWLYAFVGYFVAFNWEISRKIRSPEEEVEGLDSYTKVFGTYGAGLMVLGVRVIDTGLVALVGRHLGAGFWFYAAILLLFAFTLISFLQFRFQTTPRHARRLEHVAGLYIIAFDLTLAAELARLNGWEIL